MKEFKNFVVDKCKELGILDMENIYFSQTRDMYYADYKPNYPEKTNGDFTITQEVISGKRKIYGNLNALIPTIIELYLKQKFQVENGGNIMKRDLVDELYKTAYKRYREKYPNKDFASIPNFLDSLWFSIEGELNRNGYNAAKKYVEEAELIILK